MKTARTGQRPSAARDAGATALRAELQELLLRVRERTQLLMQPLSDEEARVQHDPLMSPIVWDLGHIAAFEQLWLRDQLDRLAQFGEMPGLYNPFEHPRAQRGALPLPSLKGALAELDRIRAETLARLEQVDFDSGSPLLAQGLVYRMVAQHESQHQETMLQTLQLKRGEPYHAPRGWELSRPRAGSDFVPGAMVHFPGGTVEIGSSDVAMTYDNERPAHELELAPFEIDVLPVTNGDYLEFMRDGGYDDERLWSGSGIEWLHETGARSPAYWSGTPGSWSERVMGVERPVDPHRPVCHVCYHEADAYARWAGKRLPTETEWEVAAAWSPSGRTAFPWGDEPLDRIHANVDQLAFDRAPLHAYEANVSPLGCYGLIGDVWEWTSSDFTPYPGFVSFPYREYSEPFFGDQYKVLRGGSWATAANVARSTFRNWDFPIRRQIFSGFRCARDI